MEIFFIIICSCVLILLIVLCFLFYRTSIEMKKDEEAVKIIEERYDTLKKEFDNYKLQMTEFLSRKTKK